MKKSIFIASLFFYTGLAAQEIPSSKIDSSNYYNYYRNSIKGLKGSRLTTNWLTQEEVIPIILEELKLAGYESLYDHCLYKLTSGQHLILSAYSRKSKFGFLYIDGHYMTPQKKDRAERNRYKLLLGIDYSQCEETESGTTNYIKIKKLPKSISTLSENVYWYQLTDSIEDNKFLVSKELIYEILRQDIKFYLQKAG